MENLDMSLSACKLRLTDAVHKFVLNTSASGYAGEWKIESTDDLIMLIWECDIADSRVAAMNPDFQGACNPPDSPWALWGGNEIIAAANIGDYTDQRSGCDTGHRFGVNIAIQYVTWEFNND